MMKLSVRFAVAFVQVLALVSPEAEAPAQEKALPAALERAMAEAEKTADDGLKAIQTLEKSDDLRVQAAVNGTRLFAQMCREARVYHDKNPADPNLLKEWKEGVEHFVACARSGKDAYEGCSGGVRGLVSPIDGHVLSYSFSLPTSYDPKKKYPLRVIPSQAKWRVIYNKPRVNPNDASRGEYLVVSPDCRGRNVCSGMGEVAAIQCIDDFMKYYAVDRTQVTIGGSSIGGSVAFRLAAFHPDRFSAIHALTSGPAVLLSAGNGRVDANLVVDNFCNTAACIFDAPGEVWFKTNREFCDRMAVLGKKHPGYFPLLELTDPKGAHNKIEEPLVARGMDWVYKYRSDPWPKLVVYKTYNLRYDGAYWAHLDTMDRADAPARIEAELQEGGRIRVAVENCGRFHLNLARELVGEAKNVRVSVNGGEAFDASTGNVVYFARTGATWDVSRERYPKGLVKRHGLSGPICDAFMEHPVLMVHGTQDGADRQKELKKVDDAIFHLWGPGNGTIAETGTQHSAFERKADAEVGADDIARKNLVLFGPVSRNKLLQRIVPSLPIKIGDDSAEIAGKTYSGRPHQRRR
ncbi:MAG: alpha/beta hydrolase [Gemmataceae bacterium]|nr:alpha/beta hydrolase [Gemmataceae bacterium]